jgi:hypothetical protein
VGGVTLVAAVAGDTLTGLVIWGTS